MKKKVLTAILAGAATLSVAFSMAACSYGGTFGLDTDQETGALVVSAENGQEGSVVTGSFKVKKGEIVVFSPQLTDGAIEVVVKKGENVVFDKRYFSTDKVLSTEKLAEGDYTVQVTCRHASGKMVICPNDEKEWAKQDAELIKELKSAGVISSDSE